MLCFTAWIARSGTVTAINLQPNFYGINNSFRDHLKVAVALAPLLKDARRGLAMQQ
jgi:hypothetical protein